MSLRNFCLEDFPSGPVIENPPPNAGDTGLIPGQGTKIPHAMGQLSLSTATTEATRPETWAPQLRTDATK